MAGKCKHPGCPDPDNIGCNIEGHANIHDCLNYILEKSDSEETQQEEDNYYRIPWTGNSFGLIDLNYLTASSKPILIGISGVASAGKTTFLAYRFTSSTMIVLTLLSSHQKIIRF